MERPVGAPAAFDEHAKLMFDLQVLAFQADLTRVITFMMSREASPRPYPRNRHSRCVSRPVAPRPVADKMGKYAKINTFHVTVRLLPRQAALHA